MLRFPFFTSCHAIVLVALTTLTFVCPFSFQPRRIPSTVRLFSADSSGSSLLEEKQLNDGSNTTAFQIELVSTKKRALDVRIFRQISITPQEYISREESACSAGKVRITEDEAIDRLMPGYDEYGNYVAFQSPHGGEVYFAAICSDDNDDDVRKYARQNGVMGVVRAQVKNYDCSNGNIATLKNTTNSNASFTEEDSLPPHVYLSNLIVDTTQRRRGIGTALMSAVTCYAESLEGIDVVMLSVDNDNVGAIRLYEKYGYKTLNQNEFCRIMFLELV